MIYITPPILHSGQEKILRSSARFKVAACGRRFGKTMLAAYWLTAADKRSAVHGNPVAFFSPTYKLLLDVWNIITFTLKPIIASSNKTEGRITFIGGGHIDFWTLQDIDAGRGRKYTKIVVDEAAHCRNLQMAWERAIAPTLTDLVGEAWFISTPKGLNYFHELFRRGGSSPGWQSFHMPTSLNPHIPTDEIASMRTELPSLVFAQEYLAEFVTFGAGLVKPDYIITGKPPINTSVVLGVDLAISQKSTADWTVIVAMTRDPHSGIIYILEVTRYRERFNDILGHIKDAAIRHKPIMIAVERTQYQAAVVQELTRTTRLPIRGILPDKDKVTRFAPLLTRYEQRIVVHDPSGVPSWFRDELLAFPDGKHDDGVDAASYAYSILPIVEARQTFKPVKPIASGW